MSDLGDFLLARIAEDEAWAEDAWARGIAGTYVWRDDEGGGCGEQGAHVGLPIGRWRAECEAKRRIVRRCRTNRGQWLKDGTFRLWDQGPLIDLAAVYADHPDYREEWRG